MIGLPRWRVFKGANSVFPIKSPLSAQYFILMASLRFEVMATIIQSLRVMTCMLRDGKFRNERANNMYETNMKTNFEDKKSRKDTFQTNPVANKS